MYICICATDSSIFTIFIECRWKNHTHYKVKFLISFGCKFTHKCCFYIKNKLENRKWWKIFYTQKSSNIATRPLISNRLFMVIWCVRVMMRDAVIIWVFSKRRNILCACKHVFLRTMSHLFKINFNSFFSLIG